MSLIEREGPVQVLKTNLKVAAIQRLEVSLVGKILFGKILSRKLVNREAFMRVIGKIWQVRRGVEIESLTGNIFSFHFNDLEDCRKVLSGAPWTFDNAILVLEELDGKGTLDTMAFNRCDFWVQIYQLPLLCTTREIGWFLGEMIGEVKEVDIGLAGDCVGKFMRIRVRIDIDKPLRRCLHMDVMGDGVETTMLLRYERLPNVCFICGRIGHMTNECMEVVENPVGEGKAKPIFGAWMKASGYLRRNSFRYQRGPHIHTNHSSGRISTAETSGLVTKANDVLSEVIVHEDKGAEEMVVGDEAMNVVPKNIQSRDSGKQGSINEGINGINACEPNKRESSAAIDSGISMIRKEEVNQVEGCGIGSDRLGCGLYKQMGTIDTEALFKSPLEEVIDKGPFVFSLPKPSIENNKEGGYRVQSEEPYIFSGVQKSGNTHKLGKKVWVRKIRADELQNFGNTGECSSGKRRGDTTISEDEDVDSSDVRNDGYVRMGRIEESEEEDRTDGDFTRIELKAARKDWLPVEIHVRYPHSNFFNLVLECQSFLADFHSCEEGNAHPPCLPGQIRNTWRPPEPEYYKINCDAAVNNNAGCIGLGIVIRDNGGFVLASCSLMLTAGFDATLAETMAIYRGLIFSRDCGLALCCLESDAAVVVKRISEGSHLDSVSGLILAEISTLITNLNVISVSHVPRLANNVAHGLAKFALKVDEDLF
ncbi:hypothetical protein EZV62_010237 [Acer yangbiense]|uniref:CCHC-type domain-containing protein n=1 Tax=Acer yangbiense TaxID=1000413 RepID=A0A5C7I124_9ROSI|nr:hypothetical protein EZV62_010237 [Acer yangbiense]